MAVAELGANLPALNTARSFVPRSIIEEHLALGIDIGGTKVVAGLVNAQGRLLRSRRQKTRGHDPRAVEETVCTLVRELETQVVSQRCIVAVGVGAAGWMDRQGETVLFSPHLSWRNEALKANLERCLHRPVFLTNDAYAAAWAEWKFGAGRGEETMALITMGTGIGGAVVRNGLVERGQFGVAGEFGHQIVVPGGQQCECGNRGCWEQYASGNALGRRARELARANSPVAQEILHKVNGDYERVTGTVVTELAQRGDPACVELVEELASWLGLGCANLAAVLDPGIFVIGGGVCEAGSLLLTPTIRAFRSNLAGRGFRAEARLTLADLGAEAGLVGAADLSRQPAAHGF